MNMDYNNIIQNAVNYIDQHLFDEINVDEIAEISYVSKKQLYRVFYSVIGHTINDYILKRRISCAANDIKTTNKKIIDIAFDNGFSAHQTFCKTFKKFTGISPSTYKIINSYFIYDAFDFNSVRDFTYDRNAVKIQNIKPYMALYCIYKSEQKDGIETRAIKYLDEFIRINNIITQNNAYIGNNCDYQFNEGKYLYYGYNVIIPYVGNFFNPFNIEKSLSNGDKISGFTTKYQTGGLYAVYNLEADNLTTHNSWNILYNIWLPQSSFCLGRHMCYEEYYKNEIIKKTRLYLPICKKNKEFEITVEELPEIKLVICRRYGVNAEYEASNTLIYYLKNVACIDIGNIFYVSSGMDDRGPWYQCAVPFSKKTDPICDHRFNIYSSVLQKGSYAQIFTPVLKDTYIIRQKLFNFINNSMNYKQSGQCFSMYKVNNWNHYSDHTDLFCYLPLQEK